MIRSNISEGVAVAFSCDLFAVDCDCIHLIACLRLEGEGPVFSALDAYISRRADSSVLTGCCRDGVVNSLFSFDMYRHRIAYRGLSLCSVVLEGHVIAFAGLFNVKYNA